MTAKQYKDEKKQIRKERKELRLRLKLARLERKATKAKAKVARAQKDSNSVKVRKYKKMPAHTKEGFLLDVN